MIALNSILVATDFSEPSAVALEYGRHFARSYGAALHLLHVAEDATLRYSGEFAAVLPDLQRDLERSARLELAKLVTDDDRRTLKIHTVVETHLKAAGGITDYARRHNIDLVIVGTHGHGALKHLVMGSVAERVVRTAPCPVLTVRAEEHDFIVPDQLTTTAHATFGA
jgi:nucleotide-binding universal stress UspA family protein